MPSTVMEPEVGASMVETQLSSVVFPGPEAPMMPTNSPGENVEAQVAEGGGPVSAAAVDFFQV